MRLITLIVLSFVLIGCGEKSQGCRSQAEMVLTCRAEEISKLGMELPWIEPYCEALYPSDTCY